jgi:peptidoglycan/LPS O-acetylase OafA/YrhL
MSKDEQKLPYMPQLDGLRAVAVGGVMLLHFPLGAVFSRYLPLWVGVELFFVLSGFLITSLLLRGAATAQYIVGFYFRRALRLFPLYYAVVGVLAIFSPGMREAWPYYVFYGVNLWVVEHRAPGVALHFWSLAVEEQFYLVWPFVVLWASRRVLTNICLALIVAAPLYRLAAAIVTDNPFLPLLAPGCVDALAGGALLAVMGPRRPKAFGLVAAAASLALTCLLTRHPASAVNIVAIYSAALPMLYVLVGGAAQGLEGAFGRFLGWRPVRYLGKISYGLYVIHYFVPAVLNPWTAAALAPFPLGTLPNKLGQIAVVALYAAISLALAALSWHLLEGPIQRRREPAIDAIAAALLRGRGRCANSDAPFVAPSPAEERRAPVQEPMRPA